MEEPLINRVELRAVDESALNEVDALPSPVVISSTQHGPLFEGLREIWDYRELLLMLARRDIKVRYKQALLGFSWAIFSPLMMMIIFSIIFSRVHFAKSPGIPYPIYVYAGLLPWMFFQGSVLEGTQSLVSNFNLVTKIYFPREVFPLASMLTRLVDLGLASVVLGLLMLYYGFSPKWTILLVPVLLLIQMLFTFGLVLFLSTANLFYRDVRKILDVIMLVWMFASNVIFPLNVGDKLGNILTFLNPMIPILDGYRDLILRGVLPPKEPLIVAACIGTLLFLMGMIFFHRIEHLFAERI